MVSRLTIGVVCTMTLVIGALAGLYVYEQQTRTRLQAINAAMGKCISSFFVASISIFGSAQVNATQFKDESRQILEIYANFTLCLEAAQQ